MSRRTVGLREQALHNRERFYLASLQAEPTVSHPASDDAQPRAKLPLVQHQRLPRKTVFVNKREAYVTSRAGATFWRESVYLCI
jgi:hypothetical protein